MVANLAENAAAKIELARCCVVPCLYHDIEKLIKPDYFTENQIVTNPHDEQTPSISALVIKAHIKEGIELARNHNLPRILIDVIRQHQHKPHSILLLLAQEAVQAANPQNEHSKSNGSNNGTIRSMKVPTL